MHRRDTEDAEGFWGFLGILRAFAVVHKHVTPVTDRACLTAETPGPQSFLFSSTLAVNIRGIEACGRLVLAMNCATI